MTTKILSVKSGPFSDVTRRRLQTLAVLVQVTMLVPLNALCYLVLPYTIFFTRYYWLALAYVGYILVEWRVTYRGGCPSDWVRGWTWWRYFADYFPIKLVKTAELHPSKNYLMCSFPHGILVAGASTNFATEATNVRNVFPGITPYLLTIPVNFNAPFMREMVMRMGVCSASRESLDYLLDEGNGTGRSVLLVVGGASEAIMTKPGTPRLFLKKRKGFVKLALKHGACLVPVFTFGENDLFDQLDNTEGTWYRWVQEGIRKALGVTFVLPIGQGLHKDSYGLLPRRIPLTTVVGKPMAAEHIPEPTQEQIDDLHSRFTEQLVALFEEHKHHYLKNPEKTHLIIE